MRTNYEPESSEESSSEQRKVITLRSRTTLPPPHNQQQRRQEGQYGGWSKDGPSVQDRLNENPELISERLLDFERIPQEKYKDIETGTFIRYLSYRNASTEPKLRLGGYLIKNGYPDYWVLKSGGRGRRATTWSVPLKGNPQKGIPANEYFMRRGILHTRDERMRYGAEVYDALKSGRYMLIETDRLEGLTNELLPGRPSSRRRPRRTFEMHNEEGEESSTEDMPKLRARFHDERSTSSEDYYYY